MPVRPILLLCLALLALGSLAAPDPVHAAERSGTLFIDSKDECATMRGAWVQRGTWQRACQTGWARDECLPLGGEWTPHVGAPAGGVCMARVSEPALARQCAGTGGRWGPPGSSMPFCQPGAPVARAVPVRKAADAGKLCDSQRDCSEGCVYEGPKVADGADVMGRCRATNVARGCFNMVEKGRLAGRICVD